MSAPTFGGGGGTGVRLRLNRGETTRLWDVEPGDRLVCAAGRGLLVAGGLVEVEYRRDAGVVLAEGGGPLVASMRGEGRGQRLPQGGPARPVLVGAAQRVVGGEPEDVERGQEEPLLDRAHGDPPAVRAGVGVVVRGAGVEQVRAPVEAPHALRTEPLNEAHDRRRGVEDVGVDDLAASAAPRLQKRADDAEGHRRRSPAEVADQVDRGDRSLPRTPDRPQRPGEADVVDVVAGHPGPGAVLAEPAQPRVHEALVGLVTRRRADAQPLGHARPVALQQYVRVADEIEHHLNAVRRLEVDGDRPTPPFDDRVHRVVAAGRTDAVDADHGGAHVGEEHDAERSRPDAGQLDDAHAGQRSGRCVLRHRRTPPRAGRATAPWRPCRGSIVAGRRRPGPRGAVAVR